jgi:hypothetical protein
MPSVLPHGLMKREQADDFCNPAKRNKLRLVPGQPAPQFKGRIRWICPACGIRETTYVEHDARLYTFLPRQGDHKLAWLGKALEFRRNSSESIFSSLEQRGFALHGQRHSRWATNEIRQAWLTGGGLLAHTLCRIAHKSGSYAEVEAEARSLGLLRLGNFAPYFCDPTPRSRFAGLIFATSFCNWPQSGRRESNPP